MSAPTVPSTAARLPPNKTSLRLAATHPIRADAGATPDTLVTSVPLTTGWARVVACLGKSSGTSGWVAARVGSCRWHLVQNRAPGSFPVAPQYGQSGELYASAATD